MRGRAVIAHHDARGVEVVIKRASLAQEFGREQDAVIAMFRAHPVDKADRHGRLDDDGRIGGVAAAQRDDAFDTGGVKAVAAAVIAGGRGDDDKARLGQRLGSIRGRAQVYVALGQPSTDLGILDGRAAGVDLPHADCVHVQCDDMMILRQQHRHRHPDIAEACYGDFHLHTRLLFWQAIAWPRADRPERCARAPRRGGAHPRRWRLDGPARIGAIGAIIRGRRIMRTAFYITVDDGYFGIGLAQARRLRKLWQIDVHVFVEGAGGVERDSSGNDGIFLHRNLMQGLIPDDLPSTKNWPRIVYGRIFAPYVMPQYDRLIYIDADVFP